MHLKTQIELKTILPKEQLEVAFKDYFLSDNSIDSVLVEMESISSLLKDRIRVYAIYGIRTESFYYLFSSDNNTIKCQIEIHSKDAAFSVQLESIFSSLKNIERMFCRKKFSKKEFLPLRIFDGKGDNTGIIISKSIFLNSLKSSILSPEWFNVIAISAAYYLFKIFHTQKYIESIIPTMLIAVFVVIVQSIGTLITNRNKIVIKVEPYV